MSDHERSIDQESIAEALNRVNYELAAATFKTLHTKTPGVHETQIASFLALLPPNAKVLEIGCGIGRDIDGLRKGEVSYYGIDNSYEMSWIDRANNQQAALSNQYLFNLGFPDNYFDGIWTPAVYHHIPPPRRLEVALSRARRTLKPNGIAFFSVREGDGAWEDPFTDIYYHRYDLDTFGIHLQNAGFTIEKANRECSRPDQVYLEYLARKL